MAIVQNLVQIWMPKLVYSLYLTLDNIKNVFFSIFIILTSLRLESFENGESQVRCVFLEEGGSCGNGEELKTAHR